MGCASRKARLAQVDDLNVGGDPASGAPVAPIMTALYFDVPRPEDSVAVKTHTSCVVDAINILVCGDLTNPCQPDGFVDRAPNAESAGDQ